jgi:hypothetical protein
MPSKCGLIQPPHTLCPDVDYKTPYPHNKTIKLQYDHKKNNNNQLRIKLCAETFPICNENSNNEENNDNADTQKLQNTNNIKTEQTQEHEQTQTNEKITKHETTTTHIVERTYKITQTYIEHRESNERHLEYIPLE